jgi:hypothetical protein
MQPSLSDEMRKRNRVDAVTIEPVGNDKAGRYNRGSVQEAPSTKRIILQRAGMWTGTLPNDVEICNTPLYQDKNPANPPDYYIGIGQSCVFNLTKGKLIDPRTDSKNSVVVWLQ